MKRAWASLKTRWEEDPLTVVYMGLGTFMMLYGLYRDLEARHDHAEHIREARRQMENLYAIRGDR